MAPVMNLHVDEINNSMVRIADDQENFFTMDVVDMCPVIPGCDDIGVSDRNIKTDFASVDEEAILDKVARLPIETWSYTDREIGVRHIGPMAQDFYNSFSVGGSDKVINMVDANGVNLAAIKALNTKLEEKDAQIQALQEQLDAVLQKLEKLS